MLTAIGHRFPRSRPRILVASLIRALLESVAADEDPIWGGGLLTASAYETAWVAQVRDPEQRDVLAFPEMLNWLLRQQGRDGAWGPHVPYSLLPTLAALVALKKAPQPTNQIQRAATRAERYLRRTMIEWSAATFDTPFFEFLVPTLLDDLAGIGVALPTTQVELMRQRRQEKLDRLPLDLLYRGQSNLIHALEGLGPNLLDYQRLAGLQASDGGYGCSPSATAAVLLYGSQWDARAAAWLRRLATKMVNSAHGGMPASYPIDVFEAAWVLYFLHHGGFPVDPVAHPAALRMLRWLRASVTPAGTGVARTGTLPPDADDTAVVLSVLNRSGVQTPLAPLQVFMGVDHFVNYPGERVASVSANAHVLEALLSSNAIGMVGSSSTDEVNTTVSPWRDKLITYLFDQRHAEGYWSDKWHLGPYYATLAAVYALARVPDPPIYQALDATRAWLLEAQQPTGGWGMASATDEETAYAVLALARLQRILPQGQTARQQHALARGARFLRHHLRQLGEPGVLSPRQSLPTLWVDKSLYRPVRVVQAAILAALYVVGIDFDG
jgi:halimadienyl-diphosphate synthase